MWLDLGPGKGKGKGNYEKIYAQNKQIRKSKLREMSTEIES